VRRSIAAYDVVFRHYAGWDWATVTGEAMRFVAPIAQFGAAYVEEMRGIADGAGVPMADVVAINVRTEVMFAAKARNAAMMLPRTLECTAFASVPDDGRPTLAGQNWDWKTHAFDTVVVLECTPDDGPAFVTVVEAGLLAKAGLNAAGLAVVTNALVTDRDLGEPGIPYHVVLRALLTATTPTEALAVVQAGVRSSSASYVVAHRDGLALGIEAAPGGFADLHLTQPDARGVVLHTNHFAHRGFRDTDVGLWLMPSTVFRYQRADRWLDRHDPGAPATYEAMLGDHAGHPESICCHPEPGAVPAEDGSTIVGLVMDTEALTVRIADGRPCEHAFRDLDVTLK
jgi:isopenicillin-N N-acyltransferase-like protein